MVLVIAKKCCNIKFFETLVKFLFSLSCGALVGDAVIHILAEAYANSETNDKLVSLVFIVSIFAFLILDRILHAVGIAHSHWVGEKCEGERENHGHHHHNISDNNHNHQVGNEDIDQENHEKKNGQKGQKDKQNSSESGKVKLSESLEKKNMITTRTNLKVEPI